MQMHRYITLWQLRRYEESAHNYRNAAIVVYADMRGRNLI